MYRAISIFIFISIDHDINVGRSVSLSIIPPFRGRICESSAGGISRDVSLAPALLPLPWNSTRREGIMQVQIIHPRVAS
jgi:hypothetical protein